MSFIYRVVSNHKGMHMIIGNGVLIANDSTNTFLEDGAVLIQGDEVKALGTTAELKQAHPEEEFFDAQGKIIMPAFINAHTHIYSAYARGMAVSKPTRNFIELLENQWWALDKCLTVEDAKLSAYATLSESIRSGVTTVIDHHAAPNHISGSLEAIAEACRDLGIRGDFCYEVSDRDGKDIAREGIAENIAFMKKYNTDEQDQIKAHLGLHASFTISDETLEHCAEEIQSVKGGYHVHVAEGIEDQYACLQEHGMRVVDRLNNFGVFGPDSLAIHCCKLHPREMMILRDTDTPVVHNPMSNMGNAVGTTPVYKMLEMGLLVGLGTDAYTNDMFESMKVAKILMSHDAGDPTRGFAQALKLQFANNPLILKRIFKKPLGTLEVGAYADIILLDYHRYTEMNENNWGGHVLFGMFGPQVSHTMSMGRWVMKDRVVCGLDEERIFAQSKERAAAIWKKL